jgi:DNA-binding transcriptional ArsR family regulator
MKRRLGIMGFQQTFKALSDPTRREILQLLKDKPLTAGEIAAQFDTSAATISHHLSILRDAGLVSDEKRGKYISYELNMSVVDEILGWFSALKGDKS